MKPTLDFHTASTDEVLHYLFTRNAAKNPRYAVNADRSAIAVWSDTDGGWVGLVSKCLSGGWMQHPGALLVNGEPLDQWTGVDAK